VPWQQLHNREEIVPQICKRLAQGEPLAVICRDMGISRRTVNHWREDDKDIAAQFDEARDDGFDVIAAQCLDIADDNGADWMTIKRGSQEIEVPNREVVDRSKLRVETRLKLLAKWDPRRYGDKLITENRNHTTLEIVDTDEMDRRLDRAVAAACAAAGAVEPDAEGT
jgi:hypothetical protein